MKQTQQLKKEIRENIKVLKKTYSKIELQEMSKRVINLLSYEPVFSCAETILLYHSLPDEVNTHLLIEEIHHRKRVILPVVIGDILELREYTNKTDLRPGPFGILEPCGAPFDAYSEIDLAVIPGVAFDRRGNRLGRGKGYYDKLLPVIDAYKLGICYPFQYFKDIIIPTEVTDIPMNKVLTTKD